LRFILRLYVVDGRQMMIGKEREGGGSAFTKVIFLYFYILTE